MAEPITIEEWLAELSRLGATDGPGDALTVREISERIGKSVETVRHQLRQAIDRGAVVAVRRRVVTICGSPAYVPAYRLVPKKKGK